MQDSFSIRNNICRPQAGEEPGKPLAPLWIFKAYLDLRANKLVSLPARIGELTNLEKLDVRWNKLSSHPEWFQRLEQRGCTVYK
jgi:hypothetical protein